MSTAGFVLACALEVLGRSANRLPPIVLVEPAPPEASPGALAFVKLGERTIYLITSSFPFRAALDAQDKSRECRGVDELRLLASIIVHEEWHLMHGPDEEGAYLAQLMELQRLGLGPGRWPYEIVRRARSQTLERSRPPSPRREVARSTPTATPP
jgi:hypothetical protein